ncbi:MAG: glycosyltransferase family 4 protein [Maribacter sp.]|nr:glycosyltransferase family 4 protein [Maribacter sp.]
MKKVLIITYYWPPAGGPGVQRWLKFVKYLPDFDITPIVYVPENPSYPIVDASFDSDIPKEVTIYKYPVKEPYRLAKLISGKHAKRISSGIIKAKNQSFIEKTMLWVRGNFFIPDARIHWVKPSVKFLSGIIEKEKIDTIITTGPPHSVHLIGYHLQKKGKFKWIADFRDPWTSIGYHKALKLSRKAKQKHKELERLVLTTADHLVVTSPTTKKEFQGISKMPIALITNGYDSEYIDDRTKTEEFTFSHIGSLLSERNPTVLWDVLAQLRKEHESFRQYFKLRLAGVVSEDVLKSINESGLENCTELLGYVSHKRALQLQQESQVLLLVEIDSPETKGILPGKLYEYMAAKRPILAIGPKNWDASKIITETNTGVTFDYTSKTDLKNVILNWFAAYQKGNLKTDSKGVEKYSRRALTKELSKLI